MQQPLFVFEVSPLSWINIALNKGFTPSHNISYNIGTDSISMTFKYWRRNEKNSYCR